MNTLNVSRWTRSALVTGIAVLFAGCELQASNEATPITPAELSQRLQQEDLFLVDVHTPQQRHIKGTDQFVPYDAVEKNLNRFPKDKNTPIYIYCESGRMGEIAARSLRALGYSNLFNLKGGERAWRAAGLPLE